MEPLEKLSYFEVRQRIDEPLLTKRLAHVTVLSPFYRDKFAQAGIEVRHLSRPEAFAELPLTRKAEILFEQEKYPPFGRLAVGDGERMLRRVHMTSGSTGTPFYVVLTENDIAATIEAGQRAFRCAGLVPGETIIHCLNYCLWAGGVTDHLSLEAACAAVIPFGVGNSRNLIKTILRLKPTGISCTPSYLSRLEVLLGDEFGMTPPALGLKKAYLGGEGGLQNPKVRGRIEETWRIKAIDANYGMADVLSIFGSECDARRGLHFHGQGILLLELFDPVTEGPLPVEEGRTGEMVLTTLRREAQPLVRYRTGDMITIVGTGTCDCGRRSLRFQVVGRSDDMIVVQGVNVFPSAVSALLAEDPHWFSGEFEFVLDTPPPYERPLLRVEFALAADLDESAEIASALLAKCRERLSFSPRLELLEYGHFPRTEGKTRRIRRS